jgi:crotonobetainyl-CoA:carnitine CoA-transferase CaiB-like acyl-CoA transferase
LVSFAFQRIEPGTETGAAPEPRPDIRPLVALYQCGDGRWVHLHGAFPRLAERTVRVLGLPEDPDRDSIGKAVARWDGPALEDALAEIGTCGALVRTNDEWRAHPQGQAVRAMARVEVERIGDGDPVPVGDGRRPLGGVRVLDLTRVLAGPTHARTLAEHGADTLLVNSPALPNVPAFVMDTSHGKLSSFVDLDDPDGAAALRELVVSADVFCQGYRSGALERRGFGPSQLAELRPGIVYVTINCYGDTGPWRERPGWEQLAQSVTGLAEAQGSPGPPTLMPAAACDYTTGYLAALGTMVALWRRAHEGGSWHVRASLGQTGNWFADLGALCDPAAAPGPSGADIARWSVTTDTPFGRLHHLGPATEMSGTQPRWDRPTVPLGAHPPAWP